MIFTDTGAWIALLDKSDRYHDAAVRIYSRLKQEKEKFLTTDYIIDETVTRLRYDAAHDIAVQFLELIDIAEKSGILKIIRIDEKIKECQTERLELKSV
ncbi:PIN domain-containing protein [Desulfonema limicola]|uniref:PIN domain-containing protein n=1 Tax=Desulfonema limicola TaxID=45656 RepID=A0A975B6I8_9BACT|nr:PIN domain-containing protein [Desulfonema limicola]QTA79726.1 PIN domain-containing protein [Desulfonema limicola]